MLIGSSGVRRRLTGNLLLFGISVETALTQRVALAAEIRKSNNVGVAKKLTRSFYVCKEALIHKNQVVAFEEVKILKLN